MDYKFSSSMHLTIRSSAAADQHSYHFEYPLKSKNLALSPFAGLLRNLVDHSGKQDKTLPLFLFKIFLSCLIALNIDY